MKLLKISNRFLCTFISVLLVGQTAAFAKDYSIPVETQVVTTQEDNLPIDVEAKSAIVIDSATGQVIYEKNASEKLEVASLTKLMSMLLFYEAVDSGQLSLDDKVTASDKACSKGGTQIFLTRGEEYTVDVLLKGVVITSANDACTALAEKISGSESAFVAKMNERASELGLANTKFVNCTGQKAEGQYSTAEDMAVISKALITHKSYFKYSSTYMDEITHTGDRKTQIINTNKLVRFYSGCDGLQTGSNGTENYCISMTAKKGQFRPIVVILGATNATKRSAGAQELMDYTFANFSATTVVKKDAVVKKSIKINDSIESAKIDALASEDFSLLLKKGEEKQITKEVVLNENLSAPLKKGDIIGQLIVKKGEEEIKRIDIYASTDVAEAGIWTYVQKIISMFSY